MHFKHLYFEWGECMSTILLIGDDRLYQVAEHVGIFELDQIPIWTAQLKDALYAYRKQYGAGRAIAAPQLGISRRLIVMDIGGVVTVFVNPTLMFFDDEKMLVWDDCMCMPGLYVQVERYKRCRIDYIDENLDPQFMELEGDLSELLQHEFDHLDGILMTMRAVDGKSFRMKEG